MLSAILMSAATMAPLNCQAEWPHIVAENPVGRVLQYESRTEENGKSSVDQETIKVIAVSAKHIVTTRTDKDGTKQETLDQKQWLDACSSDTGGAALALSRWLGSDLELIEQRLESITVRAGKFAARYMKVSFNFSLLQFSLVGSFEIWSDVRDPQRPLKMLGSLKSGDAQSFHFSHELTSLR